jgi:hypothetical protein
MKLSHAVLYETLNSRLRDKAEIGVLDWVIKRTLKNQMVNGNFKCSNIVLVVTEV